MTNFSPNLADVVHSKPSEIELGNGDEAIFDEDDLPSRGNTRDDAVLMDALDGEGDFDQPLPPKAPRAPRFPGLSAGTSPAVSVSGDFRRLVQELIQQHIAEVSEAQRAGAPGVFDSTLEPLGSSSRLLGGVETDEFRGDSFQEAVEAASMSLPLGVLPRGSPAVTASELCQKYASMSVPLGSYARVRRNSASELMCQQHMGKELQAGPLLQALDHHPQFMDAVRSMSQKRSSSNPLITISREETPLKPPRNSASMTFFDTKDFPDVESLTWYGRLAEWLQSSSFEGIIAVALLANVLWMAVSLQVNGGKTGNELGIINDEKVTADSDEWKILTQVVDTFFAVFFASEVTLRIAILRCKFWRVWMNFIDVLVSLAAIVEVAFVYTVKLPVEPMLFRLLRVGKLIRAIRMVAMTSVLASLQLLVKCLVASRDMLWWSFCLLAFVQCVAGMILSTLCQDFLSHEEYDSAVRKEVYMYYGTFTRTVLTMFEILFANWSPPCRVLVDNLSEWFSIFFLLYRCVLGFAVLNVVNAVFVQQTMKTASSDEELAFRQKERDKAMYTRKVKKLFRAMDFSGDGSISIEEFAKLVASPKLQFWISQLELEYHDLLSLFEFLDNGDGQITLNEFIEGAARLRGTAKALDVWRMETKVEVLFEEVLNVLKGKNPVPVDSEDLVQDVFDQSLFKHIQTTARSRQVSPE